MLASQHMPASCCCCTARALLGTCTRQQETNSLLAAARSTGAAYWKQLWLQPLCVVIVFGPTQQQWAWALGVQTFHLLAGRVFLVGFVTSCIMASLSLHMRPSL